MIEVKNLTKKYGNHVAVDNLSFTIETGKIYGLLGPNGAGKSTTMNIVTGCLAATSGTVLVDGHDIFEEPIEAKKHIGYLPELPPLYTEMTPYEYLQFVSEAKGVPYEEAVKEIKNVMELTGLTERRDRLIKNLSKGFRQRVGIAQAMIGNPDIIILDEPTVGLDPKQIIEIRELIKALGEKKTVIISSHILAEISAVCDHVIIISKGHLVADDSLESLEKKASRNNGLTVRVKAGISAAEAVFKKIQGVEYRDIEENNGVTTAIVTAAEGFEGTVSDAVFFAFAEAKLPICEMFYRESSLESIFLAITDNPDFIPDAVASKAGNAEQSDDAAEDEAEDEENKTEEASKAEEIAKEDDDYVPLFSSNDDEEDKK